MDDASIDSYKERNLEEEVWRLKTDKSKLESDLMAAEGKIHEFQEKIESM